MLQHHERRAPCGARKKRGGALSGIHVLHGGEARGRHLDRHRSAIARIVAKERLRAGRLRCGIGERRQRAHAALA